MSGRRGHCDAATVSADEGVDDGQPESGTAAGPRPRRIRTIEPLEHALRVLLSHPRPVVDDFQNRIVVLCADAHRDISGTRSVLHGIDHQVAEDLA